MEYVMILLILFVLAFTFSVKGRTGHKDLPALKNWYYAHRGLHGDGVPENSLLAFRKAMDAGYGMELDVHLLKDGELAIIHDSSLKRTAGANVSVENLTSQELKAYSLQGTDEKIPLLSQVLDLIQGKVPLIVEVKSVGDNYSRLCQATCDLLQKYHGLYCVESFDPRCVRWLRKNRPDIIRGQLTNNFFKTDSKLPWIAKFLMRHQLYNFLCMPDFIAYKYADRKTISNFVCRKVWGVQGVSWTIIKQEDFDIAVKEGWIPIFENMKP